MRDDNSKVPGPKKSKKEARSLSTPVLPAEVPLEEKKSLRKSVKKNVPKERGDCAPLLIVESPAKQKTIARFLKAKFEVRSSFGHVRDLPPKKIGVEVDRDFAPQYVILPRAKKLLDDFKSISSRCSAVYLATDHDREGESIAWHIVDILRLPAEKVRRITFHEITPEAIAKAVAEPRAIDAHLVQAQQARRIIDRLVGYRLSPLLWEKIQRGLSAGRVQSVAVRLLAERDREIKEFASEVYWTLTAQVELPGSPPSFEARLTAWKGQKLEATRTYDLFAEPYRVRTTTLRDRPGLVEVAAAVNGAAFKVVKVEAREARRRPPPPFSTSTLQQASSQKLYYTAERTMRVAQSLYEGVDLGEKDPAGLITYMRTDSFSVAASASAEAAAFVKEKFGATYVPPAPPVYQTKARGAQEAHEAIRPTSVNRAPDAVRPFLNADQAKLYELIWKRFVASQMTEAVYDTVSADMTAGEALFHANGRTLKFDGFLKVYAASAEAPEGEAEEAEEEEAESGLPPLKEGDVLKLDELKPEEHHTSPPPHYNEASLIRAMERHGIGRPSTYAPTIETVVKRGYVRRGMKDRKLTPTELGILVTEKLKGHFPDVVSLAYTAGVEERLDAIAEGRDAWTTVVRDFYDPFAKALAGAAKEMVRTRVEPKLSEFKCPLCEAPMLIRESRFGRYLSCQKFPKCKGKLQMGVDGQVLVPEKTGEACDLCGKDMVIRTGRKGRFLACSGYPACKNTFSLDAEGKKIENSRPVATSRSCNKCSSAFWLRLGKRGFFLACSGFPKCRNIKPVSKEEGETLRLEGEAMRAAAKAKAAQAPAG